MRGMKADEYTQPDRRGWYPLLLCRVVPWEPLIHLIIPVSMLGCLVGICFCEVLEAVMIKLCAEVLGNVLYCDHPSPVSISSSLVAACGERGGRIQGNRGERPYVYS